MDLWIRVSWICLALIHAAPALIAVQPARMQALYGLTPTGDTGALLWHRGVLFAAVFAVCVHAAIDPSARRAASLVTAISVVGYLVVYVRSGLPSGPLRKVALVDLIAIAPLGFVLQDAW